MIVFNSALLERRRRVTVKYTAAPYAASIFFKCHGSGKLTSIVCEDHRKEKFEALNAQEGIKSVKDIGHGACGIGAAEKSQHERRVEKVDGQQDGASFDTFDRVYLNWRNVWIVFQILCKIREHPSLTTALINLEMFFDAS